MRKLLVIGARRTSLGEYVADVAKQTDWWQGRVHTAGITDDEIIKLDIQDFDDIESVIGFGHYTDVVCTVGAPESDMGIMETMMINACYPLAVMDFWAVNARDLDNDFACWVSISSNSAHIVRSTSPGYCAGKAALSMGTRALARREAKLNAEEPGAAIRIWGYEPGFIFGTPMSLENKESYGSQPLHRMPDGRQGLNARTLAHVIVNDLIYFSRVRMCTMQRIDAGDQ